MKVLKEGKWNVPWVGGGICPNKECGAEIEVYECDLRPTFDTRDAFECICCVCGHSIPIGADKLPLRVREELEKKRKYRRYDARD